MAELYVKDSGTWRTIKELYVKDSGTWRSIQEAYVKDSGTWRLFFQALPSYTGVSSSNIGTITTELVTDFPDVILSAGPLFGSTKSNTAGAYEIVVAPGHRIAGDTGTNWNRSRRYVLEVGASGFSYSTASKYNLQNERSPLSTGTANNNLQFERDVSSFTTNTVLEFNHPVRWGNISASSESVYFDYTLPRATYSYSLYGGGGGGGSNNNNGDAGAGEGGATGGIRTDISISKTAGSTVRIRVGQGGVGASYKFNTSTSLHPNHAATDNAGNSLFNNFFSYGRGERGLDSGLKFGTDSEIVSTGGGGGDSAFNNSVTHSPYADSAIHQIDAGTPNGVLGSYPPFDSDADQAGGNTGVANNIGDGGTGKMGYAFSGYDGAAWIKLA